MTPVAFRDQVKNIYLLVPLCHFISLFCFRFSEPQPELCHFSLVTFEPNTAFQLSAVIAFSNFLHLLQKFLHYLPQGFVKFYPSIFFPRKCVGLINPTGKCTKFCRVLPYQKYVIFPVRFLKKIHPTTQFAARVWPRAMCIGYHIGCGDQ